jgi:hypothetical protein
MRRSTGIAALTLAVASCASQTAAPLAGRDPEAALLAPAAAELAEKIGTSRVAVLPFAAAAGAEEAGRYVSGKLAARLHDAGASLVERQRLDSVLEELALEQTGAIAEETAHEAGKVLGVEALVLGRITVLADGIDVLAWAVDPQSAEVLAMSEARLPRAMVAEKLRSNVATSAAPPIEIKTMLLGEQETARGYEVFELEESGVLRSGDGFKLSVEANRRAFVTLLILDSAGKASVLFPSDDLPSGQAVAPGQRVEIPPDDAWFFLDEQTGVETLYVLASVEPLGRLEPFLAELESVRDGGARDQTVAAFAGSRRVTRGVGGIKKGPPARIQSSDGAVVEKSQALLEGTGAVVRALSFEHR